MKNRPGPGFKSHLFLALWRSLCLSPALWRPAMTHDATTTTLFNAYLLEKLSLFNPMRSSSMSQAETIGLSDDIRSSCQAMLAF